MAENPESLISLVSHQSGNDSAVEALRRQVRTHDQVNDDKSALDKLVECVWHKDDKTLDDLKALQTKVDQDLSKGDKFAVRNLTDEIKTTVQADQSAMETQNSVDYYAGSFVKAVPLFAGKSKLLMAASIGFNALDAVHMKDQGGEVAADLALGGLKGFALKKTFDVLGAKQLSLGAEGTALNNISSVVGVGAKGIAIGGLSRLYDTGLNRQNWINKNGEVDPQQAVSMAARAAVDGRAMALDATLFITAHGAFTGMAKLGTKAIEASPLLQKAESSALGSFIKDSKMLPGSAMGATFGFSSGVVGEVTRERQAGENFDLGKVLKRGSFQALTDAAAGATGAAATRMTASTESHTGSDKMGRAFAGDDLITPKPDAGTGPHETPQVQPGVDAALKPLEPVAAVPKVELPAENGAAAHQGHELDEAFKPIFDKSVALASAAVQPGASTEDVVNFFKYAAGDGQHVRGNMEDVAQQSKQYGNTAMEALIKHAYETTPETAATLDNGLALAEAASRHGATAEQDRAFLDYAYGPGKGAEAPLRIAAELSGDTALNARLQEAYAGVHELQRQPAVQYRISLDNMNPTAADVLKTILGNLPTNGESHQLFRQNLHSWLDLVPDQHDVVRQYAHQSRYGVVAAVVDGKLGTNYLSQFPERSLTTPDLLDKLKGLDQLRAAPPATVPEIPGDQGGADNGTAPSDQATAKANPYQPAIEHLANKKVVNSDKLIEEFYGSDGRAKQARAYLLTDFIGKMNDQQFVDWYKNGLEPANRPDLPAGTTNFGLMRMAGLDVLERPEVAAAINDPDHAVIDFKTLKDFLSAPNKGATNPPLWQTEFIADRIELATQRHAMTEAPPTPEGQEPQPVDPNKIVKDAVPGWFLKGVRDRAATYDRNAGTASYPADFDDNLAQMLENQRFLERQNPKYRESTPPSNSFADRVATLEKALDVQKTTTAPELVPQILKLGIEDQAAVRGILDKLNLETNAPEYTELLKLVVPKAENIGEVKTLLDAMYFGKKSDSTAFKARKDGKSADFAERDRDNNMALALTVAQKLVNPAEADGKRLQQIVTGVITGKIRDPRPMDAGAGPGGGPGGRGGPGGAGGGREFRPRTNPPRNDRPAPEATKVVTPVSVVTQPAEVQQVTPISVVTTPAEVQLVQPTADGHQVTQPAEVQQVTPPPPADHVDDGKVQTAGNPVLNRAAGEGETSGADHEQSQTLQPASGTAAGGGPATGDGVVTDLKSVDLTPIVSADGQINAGDGQSTGSSKHIDPASLRVYPKGEGPPKPTAARILPRETDQDDDEEGGRDRGKPKGKPKGGPRVKGGHKERGGANAQRYQQDLEDDGDGPVNAPRNHIANRMSNYPGEDPD